MGNGQRSSFLAEAVAAYGTTATRPFMDRRTIKQLISLSESKLTLERDPDTSLCLRKAVLVQNVLRTSAMVKFREDDSDDDDEEEDMMAVNLARPASPPPFAHSSVHSNSQQHYHPSSSSTPKLRLQLYRTMASDASDEAHVPDMLDTHRPASPRMTRTANAFVMMDVSMDDVTPLATASPFEISPPPSPDLLEGSPDESEEEQLSKAMYAAEVERRASLIRKASACSADVGLASSMDFSLDELELGASPTKRARLVCDYKSQQQQLLNYQSTQQQNESLSFVH